MIKKGLLLSFALLMGACLPANAVWGDGDGNGTFDGSDVVRALRISGGLLKATTTDISAMDVEPASQDGKITSADAVRLVRTLAGLDPRQETASVSVNSVFSLTVSGTSVSKTFTCNGGYNVSGEIATSGGAETPHSAYLYNTSSGVFSAWSEVDETGGYSISAPSGNYQMVAETIVTILSPVFENIDIGYNVPLGSPFMVAGDISDKNFTQGALPTTANLTLNFSIPSTVFFMPQGLHLSESTPGGRNWVDREIAQTPVVTAVPKKTYLASVGGDVALSNGSTEDFNITYANTINVSGSTTKTLEIPSMAEIGGTITYPSPLTHRSVSAYGLAASTDEWIVSSNDLSLEGLYLLAVPPGKSILSVDANHPSYPNTGVTFELPVTVPSGGMTKNVTLPALPAFATVTLTILGADGEAMPNAFLNIGSVPATPPTQGLYSYWTWGITDAAGKMTCYLPAGSYEVMATVFNF